MKNSTKVVITALLCAPVGYIPFEYYSSHKNAQKKTFEVKGGQTKFDAMSPVYDAIIDSEEYISGIKFLRWWHLRKVKGDVLEISAGTGRNLEYYDSAKITSLTLADISFDMLKVAREKFASSQLPDNYKTTPVTFCLADGHCMIPNEKFKASIFSYNDAITYVPPKVEDGFHDGQVKAGEEKRTILSALWALIRSPISSASSVKSSTQSSEQEPRIVSVRSSAASKDEQGSPAHEGSKAPSHPNKSGSHECGAIHALADNYKKCCKENVTQSGFPLSRFQPASFDVVVDTFGLCSHDDPVQVLKEVARVVRPDGLIVLIEHGRGIGTINSVLDKAATKRFEKWGCWWNLDILGIVKRAGLHVEKVSRWQFGTTYVIYARPKASSGDGVELHRVADNLNDKPDKLS